jgi:L-ascorbate metabolism protein UlaG (beta-lactamase superfamily)
MKGTCFCLRPYCSAFFMIQFMYHASHTARMLDIFVVLFMIFGIALYERSIASHRFGGKSSDHFDGRKFFNPNLPTVRAMHDSRSLVSWLLARHRGEWKNVAVSPVVPPARVHEGIRVTYINHATVLIQCAGLNIITDPIWARRASPFRFAGPKRYAGPGVRLDDLPQIDIVLLSHNHYDHMDIATLRHIAKSDPRIYTGLGNTAYLRRKGIVGAHDLDWWESVMDSDVKITAVPAQHFSARSFFDRNHTLWCGFVLETPVGKIYFAGDTGYGPFVHKIAERFESFRLALIPIGAYDPAWMMQTVHTNPEEALAIHDELHIQTSIGIHHGTFRLTDEPQREPAARINAQRRDRDFQTLENGGFVALIS